MWVFLSDAFLSVIEPTPKDGGTPGDLVVRARLPGDIQRVFPDAEVIETPARDYRFRALLPRAEVAAAMARAVEGIGYTNFKGSVEDRDRHDCYMDVWEVMAGAQMDAKRRERP